MARAKSLWVAVLTPLTIGYFAEAVRAMNRYGTRPPDHETGNVGMALFIAEVCLAVLWIRLIPSNDSRRTP